MIFTEGNQKYNYPERGDLYSLILSVILRTLYLESTGKARKEAYRTALSEFYDARKSEERITAKNKNEPQKDFFSDKPFAAAFNINELSAVETTLVISDEVAMVKTGINRK